MRDRIVMRLSVILLALSLLAAALPAQGPTTRPSIVLVHGAWVDGSGWRGVFDRLTRDGFDVTVVQQPLTSFRDDVAATRRVLDLQRGPVLLVAHSYGGSVITEAGTHPAVVGLVYVAAHMPDAGESEAADGKRFPSDLGRSTAIRTTKDGFTYLDPSQFHAYFAADVPAGQAAFMARSQVLIAGANFGTPITMPAWRSKPSWMLVPTKDRIIAPELERWYAARAGSQVVEVAGASHAVYLSRPDEVAALIRTAASRSR